MKYLLLIMVFLITPILEAPKNSPHNKRLRPSIARQTPTRAPILIISIPKSGTHLLARCIELLTRRRKCTRLDHDFAATHIPTPQFLEKLLTLSQLEYRSLHLPYSPIYEQAIAKRHVKTLVIIRDPRDVLVSRVHYMRDGKCPKFKYKELSFDELLSAFIGYPKQQNGGISSWIFENNDNPQNICNIQKLYGEFIPWFENPHCCVVYFEDLIGPKGGGNKEAQERAIQKIGTFLLGKPTNKAQITYIVRLLFGGSKTFREGQIGSWKKHFTQEHVQAFKRVAPNLLQSLGYEQNAMWSN